MTRSTPLMLLLAASFSAAALPAVAAAPAATQQPASAGSAPVLVTAAQWQQMRSDGTRYRCSPRNSSAPNAWCAA